MIDFTYRILQPRISSSRRSWRACTGLCTCRSHNRLHRRQNRIRSRVCIRRACTLEYSRYEWVAAWVFPCFFFNFLLTTFAVNTVLVLAALHSFAWVDTLTRFAAILVQLESKLALSSAVLLQAHSHWNKYKVMRYMHENRILGAYFVVSHTTFSIFALFTMLALYMLARVDALTRLTAVIIQHESVLALGIAVLLLALEHAQALHARLPISTRHVFAGVDTVARFTAVHVQLASEVATGGTVLLGTLEN